MPSSSTKSLQNHLGTNTWKACSSSILFADVITKKRHSLEKPITVGGCGDEQGTAKREKQPSRENDGLMEPDSNLVCCVSNVVNASYEMYLDMLDMRFEGKQMEIKLWPLYTCKQNPANFTRSVVNGAIW